jgi:transposase InsO family protein
MKHHRDIYSVERMACVFGVSRSGYYQYIQEKHSPRQQENGRLLSLIHDVYEKSSGLYGSPRIHAVLKEQGVSCSRPRVAKLMRASGLCSKIRKKYKSKSKSVTGGIMADNLLKGNFLTHAPDQVWVSDITYISTAEGWMYLAVVLDLFSRKVIGMAMDKHITRFLVIKAFEQAVCRRKGKTPVIFHSDRGSQYTSHDFQKCLKKYEVLTSMSGKGNCYDNAVAESFFHSLKMELIYQTKYETREKAKEEIFKYVEIFYNTKRKHSYLGYLSPNEFEVKNVSTSLSTKTLQDQFIPSVTRGRGGVPIPQKA